MEYEMTKSKICFNKDIFESIEEQSIDVSFTLPDYCPDIQKILKCSVLPQIISKQISGETLDVDGNIFIKIMYVDARDKKLHIYDYSTMFTHNFKLKSNVDNMINPIILTKANVEYVNCRAISPRKLDIHGAFSISSKIKLNESKEVITGIDDSKIEQKKLKIDISNLEAGTQYQFSVNEVLELPNGKPPIENILHSMAHITTKNIKIIENKIIVKGDVTVKIFYTSDDENSSSNTMEYTVPLNQIIDVDGITEDCMVDIKLDCVSYQLQIHSDSIDEDRLIDFDIKICALIYAFKNKNISVLIDAYSKLYEMDLEYKHYNMEKFIDTINDEHIFKSTVNITEQSLEQIMYIWSDNIKIKSEKMDDNIVFSGKVDVCILALNTEGEVTLTEKNIDFEYSKSYGIKKDIRCDINAFAPTIDYHITDTGNVDVKITLNIVAGIYELISGKAICYASTDEDKLIKKDDACIIVYYGNKGENIWDIARKYGSCVEGIVQENNLSDESLNENTMLVIPV